MVKFTYYNLSSTLIRNAKLVRKVAFLRYLLDKSNNLTKFACCMSQSVTIRPSIDIAPYFGQLHWHLPMILNTDLATNPTIQCPWQYLWATHEALNSWTKAIFPLLLLGMTDTITQIRLIMTMLDWESLPIQQLVPILLRIC